MPRPRVNGLPLIEYVPEAWREPQLSDHARPIITTCELGPMGALGGKLLKDMGFTRVSILEGGFQGWKAAGLPTEAFRPGMPLR